MSIAPAVYLGLDLGASSGRAVVGLLKGDKLLHMREIYRFANSPSRLGGRLYWDFLSLWNNILESMRRCAEQGHDRLAGIGVDTWGVDFGLLGADGELLGNPICYRDSTTQGIEPYIESIMDGQRLFRLTGSRPGQVLTLSQLAVLNRGPGQSRLKCAQTFLMMSDLFRYFLCGHKGVELTAAGSSQLANVRSGRWCSSIFDKFRFPRRIMPEIVRPGTIVGRLMPELAAETGLNRSPIIAVAGHDTASAVAAVPFVDEDCAFLSCGTWSVLGVVEDRPITSATAFSHGFCSIMGVDSIYFNKASMGLYLFANLCRVLPGGTSKSIYSKMLAQASRSKPHKCFLDVNSASLFVAEDPAASVKTFLQKTGQKASQDTGSIVRVLLEGLAWSYRKTVRELATLTGRDLKRISLVGGGSKNKLLCQMTADATGLEVVAGPAEATVAGNLGLQSFAAGQLREVVDIRELVKKSFRLTTYKPKSTQLWDQNYPRYLKILEKSTNLK